MKKQKSITKAAALLLALLLLLPVFPNVHRASAAGTAIASAGKSGVYRWKWIYCNSIDKVKQTNFTNRNYSSISGLGCDYAMLLTSKNKDHYFASMPSDNKEDWWCSGAPSDTEWFDVSGAPFLTTDRKSSMLIEHTASLTNAKGFSLKVFFDPDNNVSYDKSTGKITKNTSKLYGLRNDGDTDWRLNSGSEGEDFSFYFFGAPGIPKNTDFYKEKNGVKIFETDNTNYMWDAYDNYQALNETKGGDNDSKVFHLWIGHYENIPGIPKGEYYIPEGQTMTLDDEISLIPEETTLEIKKDAVLYVKGTLYLEGYIKNNGTIIVEDGGKIVIGKDQTFGGIYTNGGAGNNGNFVIDFGGELDITCRYDSYYDPEMAMFISKSTCFIVNDGNFTCDGKLSFRTSPYSIRFNGSTVRLMRQAIVNIPQIMDFPVLDMIINAYFYAPSTLRLTNDAHFYIGNRLID